MPSVSYDNLWGMQDLSFSLIFSPNISSSAVPTAVSRAETQGPVSGDAWQGLAGAGQEPSELEGSSQDVPGAASCAGWVCKSLPLGARRLTGGNRGQKTPSGSDGRRGEHRSGGDRGASVRKEAARWQQAGPPRGNFTNRH